MLREGCCAGAVQGNGGVGGGGVPGSAGCTVVQRCGLVWEGWDCDLDSADSSNLIFLSDAVLW